MRFRSVSVALATLASGVFVQPWAQQPTFEVASVKPNTSDALSQPPLLQPGGRLIATNVTLARLIRAAYGLRDIAGGPPWIDRDRFDIIARSDRLAALNTPEFVRQAWSSLRTLLEERFALRVHTETRQMPIYALVTERSDGTLGPRMTRSDVDCAALLDAMKKGERIVASPSRTAGPPCSMAGGSGLIRGNALDMTRLAGTLGNHVDRPVLDRTGLAGVFDLELKWSPDATPDGVSVFTALQEQLGLKLQPGTGPIDVLVIDSVQQLIPD